MSDKRSIRQVRQARVPLARIAHRLAAAKKRQATKAIIFSALSLTSLVFASAAVISARPLSSYSDFLVAMASSTKLGTENDIANKDKASVEAEAIEVAGKVSSAHEAVRSDVDASANTMIQSDQLTSSRQDQTNTRVSELSQDSTNTAISSPSFQEEISGIEKNTTLSAVVLPADKTEMRSIDPAISILKPQDKSLEQTTLLSNNSLALGHVPQDTGLLLSLNVPRGSWQGAGLEQRERSAALALRSPAIVEASCAVQVRSLVQSVSILFESGSSAVTFPQIPKVRELAKAITSCPEAKVDVGGHTDKTGEQVSNLQLSWQRAEAVIKTIKSLGFNTSQFSPVGFSASRPITQDSSPKAQVLNRRVEFIVR